MEMTTKPFRKKRKISFLAAMSSINKFMREQTLLVVKLLYKTPGRSGLEKSLVR